MIQIIFHIMLYDIEKFDNSISNVEENFQGPVI